jgi:SAM-dependent methyltransferase
MTPAPEVELIEEAEAFFREWQIYRKVVEHNYLYHREVYALLHQFLTRLSRPFMLLDLGCGDAESMVQALAGTTVSRYVGVDLAPGALALAGKNLCRLPCSHRLVEKDYYEFMRESPVKAEVIWMGLTFHHLPLPQKAAFLRLARQTLPPGGHLLMFEPTLLEGETREQFLDRSLSVAWRSWQALTKEEMQKLDDHVSRCDFPEEVPVLTRMGREQGFSDVSLLFQDPRKIYSFLCFAA